MIREKLLGTWKLVSDERHTDGGEIFYPFGKDVVGQIIYDSAGFMAVNVTTQNRREMVARDREDFTPEDALKAFKSYLAYFGTYTIDEEKGAVIHHVVSCTFPQMIGAHNVRFYRFDGKRLILKTPPVTVDGKQAVSYITWERPE
jgi:hypothetical protein